MKKNNSSHWRSLFSFMAVLALACGYFFWLLAGPELPSTEEGDQAQTQLTSIDCPFKKPFYMVVDCYRHSTSDGKFQLAVTVIRDQSAAHNQDPLVYLAGGPGGDTGTSSEDDLVYWYYWLQDAQLERDLVLVDQRGTGASTPNWRCANYNSAVIEAIASPLSLRNEYQLLWEAVRGCLQSPPASLGQADYGTLLSAGDMNAILPALGYSEWNVLGSSYGSRLALAWAASAPDNIRSLILDSTYPMDQGKPVQRPLLFMDALQRFADYCNNHECYYNGEALLDAFQQALMILREQPLTLSVRLGHEQRPLVVTDFRFFNSARSTFYQPKYYADLSEVIAEVVEGSETYPALSDLVGRSFRGELTDSFNPLTYYLVHCAETQILSDAELQHSLMGLGDLARYFQFDAEFDFCQLLGNDSVVLSDVLDISKISAPTLLIAGYYDPVTPAHWAEQLNFELKRSQIWLDESGGHGVSSQNLCVLSSLQKFLSGPTKNWSPEC